MSITNVSTIFMEQGTQYNEHPEAHSDAYLQWFDLVPALEDRVMGASTRVSSRIIDHQSKEGRIFIDKEVQCLLPPAIPKHIMQEMECPEENNREKAPWAIEEEAEAVRLGDEDNTTHSECVVQEELNLSEDSEEDTLEAEELTVSFH